MASSWSAMAASSSIVLVLVLLISSCTPSAGARSVAMMEMPGMPPMPSMPGNDALNLSADLGANYTTFVQVVTQTGLIVQVVLLAAQSGATVLAPSNDAFIALGPLLECVAQNALVLESVLRYHVIVGAYPAQSIITQTSLPTALEGTNVTIAYDVAMGTVMIDGTAKVIAADLYNSPSLVVHGIDSVLVPPLFAGVIAALCGPAASAPAPAMGGNL